ncbi:cysteine proteinase [Boletus edulis BED1]|uniref:ubiquitinyl hydrolase 1 n=1 Tax=Boletus edulis BED1 TaxID=1328754 RepID=A0AAD4BKA8_BOLED|nr:cysteine proteinase [Boletus edulis BED1]
MDHSDPARRLPSPPQPTSSASASKAPSTVSPSSFYASKPPPLPSRKNVGSSHTKVVQPGTPPPVYGSMDASPFREPQLVEETPITNDPIPGLLPADDAWGQADSSWAGTQATWGTSTDTWSTDATPWDSTGTWTQPYGASQGPIIDGRDKSEEDHWWDASVRDIHKRPGPGVLPPYLADLLHNPDHSLFSVSVNQPDFKPLASSQESGEVCQSFQPPSVDDLNYSIPHPNAYYCRKHNGWVLLQWKSSMIMPPLAKSFVPDPETPFPDLARRKRMTSCVGGGEQHFGQANLSHHFHRYEKAVDALKLDPAFRRSEWEMSVQKKQKRRKVTSLDLDAISLHRMEGNAMEDVLPEEEDDLLDLYVCCQCSLYCIVSEVIPGVIPVKYIEEFTRERWDNPAIGRNKEESVVSGLETFLLVVENKLWKGQHRGITISRPVFQRKIGWTPVVRCIFEHLGFIYAETVTPAGERDTSITPPITDPSTLEGRQNGRKLLRFWVETSAWLLDYQRRYANALKQYTCARVWVKLDPVREMYQMGIGAHPDQTIRALGLTPMTYSPGASISSMIYSTLKRWYLELLAFAYLAQCRCDPKQTPHYFTQFYSVIQAIQQYGDLPSQELQNLVLQERTRNRYTDDDRLGAIRVLGFGKDNLLRVDYEDDIDEDFLVGAWKDCLKRAWRDPKDGAQRLRDANDAFRIVAESRGSVNLQKVLEDFLRDSIDPSRAYTILEIPPETDDAMLMTVFMLRLDEQPQQAERMKEALLTLAEARDSCRLRTFLETGQDPGEIVPAMRLDFPRGLNQLGNTCYLNSLLQYFYTIKELRDAVAPLAKMSVKALEDEKYSDDDLKRHRVGGRLVTRREIFRSKKFVSQLANLFWNLEHAEEVAVTPTMDLAKLALVTSRDEEDDEAESRGTDSSNDTDATLVDDSQSPGRLANADASDSVLGKRARDDNAMDVDEDASPKSPMSDSEKNGYVMVSHPSSPRRSKSPRLDSAGSSNSSSKSTSSKQAGAKEPVQQGDDDVPAQPPLPERKTQTTSDSVMLFGKQHDVSECMDNCMFQIEIALLNFSGLSDPQEKGSLVKRLFYGKLRQRLTPDQRKSRASVTEKQDLFSHLPVNVSDSGIDIYDGLSRYFDDLVDYEGGKARMEVSLVELPPLMQIQLQRVQFNRETLQPYKSQAYVKFGKTIYMDRFLDSADPHKKAKSKRIQTTLIARRERLRLLTEHKHAPFGPCLDSTLNFLTKQENVVLPQLDDELVAQLNNEQQVIQSEVEGLREDIVRLKEELEDLWKDDTTFAYELTSVFIHRGSSPSFGHYFFYSRNLPDKPDEWFKYNDSTVTEGPKDEVLADTTGSNANPYLLVFARKGSDVVHTVKRITSLAEDPKT